MGFFYISEDTTTDRYDMKRFVDWQDDRYIMTNSYFIYNLKKLPSVNVYRCSGERPDIMAYKIYGDTQLWWILLAYNDIIDFSDGSLDTGNVISYPSLSDIETLMFSLNALQRAVSS